MASKLFDYDNPFFMLMSRIWDLMILNFLAAVLCLPVITAGASVTALYYVTLKMAEERESHIYRSFFNAFRENFWQSTSIHIIMGVSGAVLLLDWWYFVHGGQELLAEVSVTAYAGPLSSGSTSRLVVTVIFLTLLLIYLFTLLYVYAVQARFVNPIRRTISNAFIMAVRHLPSTILMAAMNAIFFYIALTYASWLSFWAISGPVYLNSLLICRIFKLYMTRAAHNTLCSDRNRQNAEE